MKNLFYLIFFTLLLSCGKDNSNSLAGSYIAKSLKITYDLYPGDNVDVTFTDMDCVDAPDGFFGAEKYCRSGKLIINDDDTFLGTIKIIWKLIDVNTFTTSYKVIGKGEISKSGETAILCYDNGKCLDLIVNGNTITINEDTGSSIHTQFTLTKE